MAARKVRNQSNDVGSSTSTQPSQAGNPGSRSGNRAGSAESQHFNQSTGTDSERTGPPEHENSSYPSGSPEGTHRKEQNTPKEGTAPKDDPAIREFPEGAGEQSRFWLNGKSEFKNQEIKGEEENFGTRYTGQTTGAVEQMQGARPKTELRDLPLSKPETSKERGEQPIPLEYQDILK